ncbi:hypothetical protein FACS1894189_5000 [Planctomycetales bacterium]|nr:hypothetical protein FACS1894189_5000 [Planctomycetales bacterium]
MKRTIAFSLLIVSLFLLPFTGCGNNNVKLTGKVTFSDTGEPLSCGVIFFDSDGVTAKAGIQPNGTYAAGTQKEKNGVPSGTYRVRIVNADIRVPGFEIDMTDPLRGHDHRLRLIDPKYEKTATSGLTVNTAESKGVFNIQVERCPKKNEILYR